MPKVDSTKMVFPPDEYLQEAWVRYQDAGSIEEREASIHVSNVMLIDPKSKTRTRIGHTTNKKGKKVRVAKKSNQEID